MRSKYLVMAVLLLTHATVVLASEKAGIGLYVWVPDQQTVIADKTRMRLIVEMGTGDPVVVLRDFARGSSTQAIVNELVAILRGHGLTVTHEMTKQGRNLLTVKGAKALRVSYSPSTVLTELADARELEDLPVLVASDSGIAR